MKNILVSLYYWFPAIIAMILVLLTPIPSAQLETSENKILFQVQMLLEYPQVLKEYWNNLNNFCNLPPSSFLNIVCSDGHVTELTIIGNKSSQETLSKRFSIDSFFTVLTNLSNMKVLSLVSLGLWGPLPSKISRFKSLEVLNITSNSIYGEIPSSISLLKNLKSLVLADNLFNGEIPSFLFSLPFLQNLNLAANQLNGSLSVNISCSSSLTFIDISQNFLVGNLPSCIKSSNRTILYSGNCLSDRSFNDQYPSSHCIKTQDLAVKPKLERERESKIRLLYLVLGIIGSVVGISVAGFLVLLILLFILRNSKAEREDNNINRSVVDDKFSVKAFPRPNIDAGSVPQLKRLVALGFPPYSIFTLTEIEDATKNFDPSNLIEGSDGQLYKGRLSDGSMVMVNSIKLKQKSLSKIIVQNLKVLPYLRHRHLVSVLGHCVVTNEDRPQTKSAIFIVIEHISNVSLRVHLKDRRKKEILKWPQRMAISIGIARGIQFLHTGVNPGIYGNNIKIDNILLDNSLNPKLSGYSIPLPLPSKKGFDRKFNKQNAQNHIGSTNDAEKEDIYQLGVILLEVITGKIITSSSEVEELKHELERGLSEAGSPTTLMGATDPSLRGTYTYESLNTAVQITINCLNKVSNNRPSIEDILWNLQYSMQVQDARSSKSSI